MYCCHERHYSFHPPTSEKSARNMCFGSICDFIRLGSTMSCCCCFTMPMRGNTLHQGGGEGRRGPSSHKITQIHHADQGEHPAAMIRGDD